MFDKILLTQKYGYFAETPDWKLTSEFFTSWNKFLVAFVKARQEVECAIKAENSDSTPQFKFNIRKRSEMLKSADLKATPLKTVNLTSQTQEEKDNEGNWISIFVN